MHWRIFSWKNPWRSDSVLLGLPNSFGNEPVRKAYGMDSLDRNAFVHMALEHGIHSIVWAYAIDVLER